jgi:hypothetical protein
VDSGTIISGVVLVLLGAVAATVTTDRLAGTPRARWTPVAVLPFGVLIGAGAALVRGWDLPGSMLAGAVVVPLLTVVARLREVRRANRRRP